MTKIISILLLICLFPIFAIVALAIIIDDGFPVFFRQKRIGLDNKHFWIYKFRTMINDSQKIESYIKNIANNKIYQRIPLTAEIYTGIGRWFERLQLVELPQLFNVLRGNMSLVGNRPLPKHVHLQLIGTFNEKMINDRMGILPGMTGVSQIIGKYKLNDQERLEFEVNYVEFRMKSRQISSLYLNFLILLETFFLIFTGKGLSVVNRKIVSMLKINS